MAVRTLILTIATALAAGSVQASETDFRTQLEQYLERRARAYLAARTAKVQSLNAAGLRTRQKEFREWLIDAMGGFPERTALRPRVTDVVERDGYRIEKLIFESQPRFYVTANVYVPTGGKRPYPAVLGTAGHSNEGKAEPVYQHAWISLVRRGFLVLAYDPPGQGERSEYFDPAAGRSRVGLGVREHNMAGAQCLLTGTNVALHEVWDGIRALDYLLTRDDVDATRVAVAGNSGGGTQSAYLAAVEPRLAAAVVSCYLTSWEKQWSNPGPQDAEQNFPAFLKAGYDFADLMLAFAPRPITMLTGIRDFFPIAGARDTYREVLGAFEKLGAAERAGYFEYDDTHGWTLPRRQATYRWLSRWLLERSEDGTEAPLTPEKPGSLYATGGGQVAVLGGETVHSLNAALAERQYQARTAARLDREGVRKLLASTLAIQPARSKPRVRVLTERASTGYKVKKLAITVDEGLEIPALDFEPDSSRGPAILSVSSEGMTAGALRFDELARDGTRVLAIDPRGWGESGSEKGTGGYSADWQTAQRALLLGDPLIAMQTRDVLSAFDYLQDGKREVRLTGNRDGSLLALFAGAVEPRIAGISLKGMPLSYRHLALAPIHRMSLGIVIPGVMRQWDVPDVIRSVAPRPVCITDSRDAEGRPVALRAAEKEYAGTGAAVRETCSPE